MRATEAAQIRLGVRKARTEIDHHTSLLELTTPLAQRAHHEVWERHLNPRKGS